MAFSEPSIYIAIYKKDFGKVLSDFVHQRAIYFGEKNAKNGKLVPVFPESPSTKNCEKSRKMGVLTMFSVFLQ